ncbi:TPA: hypothetical protein IUW47_000365 [Enterococcus faecalis]|nr:hypothetical protein [Enterococcus faecalis]
MSAFLGLSSLLGLFVTSVYFVYCIFKKRNNLSYFVWIYMILIGLFFTALELFIPGTLFLFISLYKILKDPKAKKFLHEQEIKRTEKIIEKQNPIQKFTESNSNETEQNQKVAPTYSNDYYHSDKKAGLFHLGVYCPYCKNLNVQYMHNNRKGFSVGKAAGGALLTGGIGTLAGFAGKKGKKNTWRCNNCGCTFKSAK